MAEGAFPDNTNQPEILPPDNHLPAENAAPPARVRKTHISDAVSTMLKSLSLPSRLKRNKEIEQKNEARNLMTLRHMEDPTGNPQPGSETASFVTIDSSDFKILSSSTIFESLRDNIPFYIIRKLADFNLTNDKISKRQNSDESLTDLNEDPALARAAKRRCMTAKTLVRRNFQQRISFNFPQIMFETEDRMPLPLPFFTHKSLRYLIDHLALLPVRKVEADGIHKKGAILDVEKCSKILGDELSLSFGQYTEAATQMYNFQAQRDKDSPDDGETWTQFWELHFLFFENQHDAEEYYEEWKHVELDLRRERWSYGYAYDAEHYVQRYMTAKNNMIQRLRFEEEMNRRESKWRAQLDSKPRNRDFVSSGHPSRFNNNKPFPEAGSRPSVASSCVLCADRSHSVFNHPRDKTKFADGKPLWAKWNGKILTSPDGRELCLRFNIGGGQYCGFYKDRHGDSRLHVCSFCGDRSHHALSWTCKKRDN
jgi:hypothetical protein